MDANKWLSEHIIPYSLLVIAAELFIQFAIIPLVRLVLKTTSSRFRKRQVENAKEDAKTALALSRDRFAHLEYLVRTLNFRTEFIVACVLLATMQGLILLFQPLGRQSHFAFVILFAIVALNIVGVVPTLRLMQRVNRRESIMRLAKETLDGKPRSRKS